MNCTKCKTQGVENTVLGKTFFYCRTCKDEIFPPKETELEAAIKSILWNDAVQPGNIYYSNVALPNSYPVGLPTGAPAGSTAKITRRAGHTTAQAVRQKVLGGTSMPNIPPRDHAFDPDCSCVDCILDQKDYT